LASKQRSVGRRDEVFGALAGFELGGAETHRERRAVVEVGMLGDRRPNPEPDFLGRLDPAVDEQHGELVASPAKAGVGGPHGGPQHLGAACQGTVACEMAEAVVDRLEAVEVDEEQAEPPSVAFAPRQLDLERLVEAAPVSQSRQVVEPRLATSSSRIWRAAPKMAQTMKARRQVNAAWSSSSLTRTALALS
jgi:hypothetical protein